MNIYYNEDYVSCGYNFDTTRKSKHIAEALSQNPEKFRICDPSALYEETQISIRSTHDSRYVDSVITGEPRDLATSQGFQWDPMIFKMALAHNAGVVAALTEANNGNTSGSLSSGLHHSNYLSGSGFCTFNGIAVAVNNILSNQDRKVLVIDLDAHCGGGTYSLLKGRFTQIDISTSSFDYYKVDHDDSLSVLKIVDSESLYLKEIYNTLQSFNDQDFDVCLYNAGMDPYNTGISEKTLAARETLVASWLHEKKIPSAFVLAGGYTWGDCTMEKIVSLHCLTADAFEEFSLSDTRVGSLNA